MSASHGTDARAPGVVSFDSALTPRGYRGVMLHLAARMLRFVPAIVAVAGMMAYGVGARTTALMLFAGLLAIPLVVWGYVSWLANSPSARSLYTPVRWRFSAENIEYSSADGDGEIGWDAVTRWRTAAGHVMLYVAGSSYVLVPLEAVGSEQREMLREILLAGAGKAPRRDDGLR